MRDFQKQQKILQTPKDEWYAKYIFSIQQLLCVEAVWGLLLGNTVGDCLAGAFSPSLSMFWRLARHTHLLLNYLSQLAAPGA